MLKFLRYLGQTSNSKNNNHEILQAKSNFNLFDGYDLLFKKALENTNVYGEYGIGESTKYALENSRASIFAVETSRNYYDEIIDFAKPYPGRLQLELVNVGPVGDWGYPLNYSNRVNFPKYFESIWKNDFKPDLVLIDGRFRVASFCCSILSSDPETQIIFDDYIYRPHYHLIEEFIKPSFTDDRQALFITPKKFNRALAQKILDEFKFVLP